MSNVPGPARPALLSSLESSPADEKLRISGRLLSYDHEAQLLLIHDETNHACLVDMSLCLESMLDLPDLRESKTFVMIVGYLERLKNALPIPTIPAFVEAPMVDPQIVLRAILLNPCPDLDLTLWSQSIREREEANINVLIVEP